MKVWPQPPSPPAVPPRPAHLRLARAAVVVSLALLSLWQGLGAGHAAPPEGALTLSAPAREPVGRDFTLTLSAAAPTVGLYALQAQVGTANLLSLSSSPPPSFSPACVWTAYNPSVGLVGCVTYPQVVTSGLTVALSARCTAPGTGSLALLPRPPGVSLGSYFIGPDGQYIDPVLTGVSVECVSQCAWVDLNHDGSISVADIGLAAAGFGTASPDLDFDGTVSIADLLLVARSYGQVC